MKILSIIGTRPQYVKIKPFYDYAMDKCQHVLVDTNQHYDDKMSKQFINEFGLCVDYNLECTVSSPSSFIGDAITKIADICKIEKPDIVSVFGDTNSTLASALAAHKLGITVAHMEAGIRCDSMNMPEEMNRILVDTMSNIHFVSRSQDIGNVSSPVHIGDLEYVYLNSLPEISITHNGPCVLTIHRKENLNENSIRTIFRNIENSNDTFVCPLQHSLLEVINRFEINIPKNISIIPPQKYSDMINILAKCKFIISDSAGVQKICPFFGKKCIVPMSTRVWDDVFESGYAIKGSSIENNESWLNEPISINKDFYYKKNCCEIIMNTFRGLL